MQSIRKLFFFMFLLTGMVSLQACDSNDGPLEDAAENVDDAIDDAGDAIEEACEDATDSNCD
jgi:hypothetical protein